MEEINVEKIMEEIRHEIDAEDLKESDLHIDHFGPESFVLNDTGVFSEDALIKDCEMMNAGYSVSTWHPIRSNKPIIGPFITFLKKLSRKSTRFIIDPIVHDQNEFNKQMTKGFNQARNYIIEDKKKKKDDREILDKLRIENKELTDRLEKLEREYNSLIGRK